MTDTRRAQRPRRAAGPADAGVSDVLGSVLLVGITVLMAVGLGALILAFDGPPRLPRAEVATVVDPGAGGWGTGDETVRLVHRGGDPLDAAQTTVIVQVGSTVTRLHGASQLASVFGDGKLTIGETWQYPAAIAQGQSVQVRLLNSQGDNVVLLANSAIVAAQTTTTQPCSSDHNVPSAIWAQTPNLLSATTSGSVRIDVQVTDDCWGVNALAQTPTLFYRLAPTVTTPTTGAGSVAYLPLTLAPSGPPNTYTATVPAQAWSSRVGYYLQYYLSPVSDLGGNTGATAIRSVVVLANCGSDITAPALTAHTQSPADVRTTTLTGVTVTAAFADDCSGLQTVKPHLWWRVNPGTSLADATPAGMDPVAGQSGNWTGTIGLPGIGWAGYAGQVLEYYVTGQIDANGNVGTTATFSDPIELVATYTYPTGSTVTAGTIDSLAPLQLATDGGAFSTLREAGTSGSPTTQSFNANSVISANGWTTATSTKLGASDDQYATYATDGPGTANDLLVGLADPGTNVGAITRVVMSAEVSVVGYANDGFQIQACLSGGTCTPASSTVGGSATDNTVTYDVTAIKPGAVGSAWSWTDITNLQEQVHLTQQGQKDGTWRVDRAWADVTFQVSTYTMSIRLDWTTVPTSGLSPTLDLRYNTAGDTFRVEVCTLAAVTGTCGGTWVSHGTLTATSGMTTFQTPLTSVPSESVAGKVAVRFVDTTPTGTAQGFLYIDYARVSTL